MSDLLRKKTRALPIIALLTLVVLLIGAALIGGWMHYRPQAQSSPPWQVVIERLQQTVQSEREALQALSQQLEHLRTSVRETTSLVDNQQAEQVALAQTLQAVRQLAQSASSAASGSEQELKALQAQVALLEQRLNQPLASAKPATPIAKPVVARGGAAKPQPLVPPFRVLDVEYRGGERFLMIASKNSQSLADIRFLREGDSLSGWQLSALSPQQAVFAVGNRHHAIALRPVLSMN